MALTTTAAAAKNILYDVVRDPGELDNLAPRYPEDTMALQERMDKYRTQNGLLVDEMRSDPTCVGGPEIPVTFGKTPWGKSAWVPWCSLKDEDDKGAGTSMAKVARI